MVARYILIATAPLILTGCATLNSQQIKFTNLERSVPAIVNNLDWTEIGRDILTKKGDIVWHSVTYFKHPDRYWYMASHTIFGRETIKAYGVSDSNDNLLEHWFLVRAPEGWYLAKSSKLRFEWKSFEGINSVGIFIDDDQGRPIIVTWVNER